MLKARIKTNRSNIRQLPVLFVFFLCSLLFHGPGSQAQPPRQAPGGQGGVGPAGQDIQSRIGSKLQELDTLLNGVKETSRNQRALDQARALLNALSNQLTQEGDLNRQLPAPGLDGSRKRNEGDQPAIRLSPDNLVLDNNGRRIELHLERTQNTWAFQGVVTDASGKQFEIEKQFVRPSNLKTMLSRLVKRAPDGTARNRMIGWGNRVGLADFDDGDVRDTQPAELTLSRQFGSRIGELLTTAKQRLDLLKAFQNRDSGTLQGLPDRVRSKLREQFGQISDRRLRGITEQIDRRMTLLQRQVEDRLPALADFRDEEPGSVKETFIEKTKSQFPALEETIITMIDRLENQKTDTGLTKKTVADAISILIETSQFFDRTTPELSILSPSEGAFLPTSQPPVRGMLKDNLSGIDAEQLTLKLNGMDMTPHTEIVEQEEEGKYLFTLSLPPTVLLPDGETVVTASVKDRGINEVEKERTFVIDTTPPDLRLVVESSNRTFIDPFGKTIDVSKNNRVIMFIDDTVSGADRVSGLNHDAILIKHNGADVTGRYNVSRIDRNRQTRTFTPKEGALANLNPGVNELTFSTADELDNRQTRGSEFNVPREPPFGDRTFRVRIENVSGDRQKALAGRPLDPTPRKDDDHKLLKVRVTDPATGNALPGVPVRWKFSEPGARIIPPYNEDGTTDERGIAFTNVMMPEPELEENRPSREMTVSATVDFAEIAGRSARFTVEVQRPRVPDPFPDLSSFMTLSLDKEPPPNLSHTPQFLVGSGAGDQFTPFQRVNSQGGSVSVEKPPFFLFPRQRSVGNDATARSMVVQRNAGSSPGEKRTFQVKLKHAPNTRYGEWKIDPEEPPDFVYGKHDVSCFPDPLRPTGEPTSLGEISNLLEQDDLKNVQVGMTGTTITVTVRVLEYLKKVIECREKQQEDNDVAIRPLLSVRAFTSRPPFPSPNLMESVEVKRVGSDQFVDLSQTEWVLKNIEEPGIFNEIVLTASNDESDQLLKAFRVKFTPESLGPWKIGTQLMTPFAFGFPQGLILFKPQLPPNVGETMKIAPPDVSLTRKVMDWKENGGVRRNGDGTPCVARDKNDDPVFEPIGYPGTAGPDQVVEPKFPVTVNESGQTVPRHVDEKTEFYVQARVPVEIEKAEARVFTRIRSGGEQKDQPLTDGTVPTTANHGPFARTSIKVKLKEAKSQPAPDRFTVVRSDPIVVTGQGTKLDPNNVKSAGGTVTNNGLVKKLPGDQHALQYRGDGTVQAELLSVIKEEDTIPVNVPKEPGHPGVITEPRPVNTPRLEIMQKRVILLGIDSLGFNQLLKIENGFPWNELFGKFERLVNVGIPNNEGSSIKRYSKGIKINALADWPPITFANWASIYTGEPPGKTLIPGNNFWARLATPSFAGRRNIVSEKFIERGFANFTFNTKIPFRLFSFSSTLFNRKLTSNVTSKIPEDLFGAYYTFPSNGSNLPVGSIYPGLLNISLNGSNALIGARNFDFSVDTIYEDIKENKVIETDQMWDVMQRNTRGANIGQRWVTFLNVAKDTQDIGLVEKKFAGTSKGDAFFRDNSIIETFIQRTDTIENSKLTSIYLPGNDKVFHSDGFSSAKQYMKNWLPGEVGDADTDDGLQGVFNHLKQNNAFHNSVWVLLSDHSQHEFGTNISLENIKELESDNEKDITNASEDKFQITQKELSIVSGLPYKPPFTPETTNNSANSFADFIESSKANDIDNIENLRRPFADTIAIPDDSIAHIYVLEDQVHNVTTAPSQGDIIATADKFWNIAQVFGSMNDRFEELVRRKKKNVEDFNAPWVSFSDTKNLELNKLQHAFGEESGGLILVKLPEKTDNGVKWDAPYHVYRGGNKDPLPITQFSNWPTGTIRDVVHQIQEANSARMGEIVLIPNKHFYFSDNAESNRLDSGHGSLLHQDANVPFQVGGPNMTSEQVDTMTNVMKGFRTEMTGASDHFVENSEVEQYIQFLLGTSSSNNWGK